MITREEGMVGMVIGKWMIGIDWSKGWKRIYVFVFDMDMEDDVWRSG